MIEKMAEAMHDAYELAAKEAGWETQVQCRVPYEDLPEANKLAMLACARAASEVVEERIEDLEEALQRIQQWAEAYPTNIFKPMDDGYAKKAHEILLVHGMKIDRISADAMRHCLKGVGRIARGALEGETDA